MIEMTYWIVVVTHWLLFRLLRINTSFELPVTPRLYEGSLQKQ